MDFMLFKAAVAKQFKRMQDYPMFRTTAPKDELWETYLSSFPAGTNPIYLERTSHDCNCCKQFIRAIGNVVALINGELESIWDIEIDDEAYNIVSAQLALKATSYPIDNVFYHYENFAGTNNNFQQTLSGVKTWNHFHVNIPSKYVLKSVDIGPKLGELRSSFDVLRRGLIELDLESINIVLDLISQNSLYRGEEHKASIIKFKEAKTTYNQTPTAQQDFLVWSLSTDIALARFRNTVIGTLITDIADGKELDQAVASFEAKVAPTNYKRPTALVTKSMIEDAQKKVIELGLESSLGRRYAVLEDIKISNILFADRNAKKAISADIFNTLKENVSEVVSNNIEECTIENFVTKILPTVTSMEVLLDNHHTGNLVSLIAPITPNANQLFKWNNEFSWSYNGEVADSIKERVKNAGGNTTGDLCCRLAWFNFDDLDLSMIEPNGNRIYFNNKRNPYTGGQLDVDMNAGMGRSRTPVENIFYPNKSKMKEGIYQLVVHNFYKRETNDVGFDVEIDFMGSITNISQAEAIANNQRITVAEFTYTHANGIEFKGDLKSNKLKKELWGLSTQTFHKVKVMMNSPNFWDDEKELGNKHYFFMLDQCNNPEGTRGFYNEFLNSNLEKHRKVFEMVGSKMKTEPSEHQLSGLGFSSTQKASVVVRVKSSFERVLKIVF